MVDDSEQLVIGWHCHASHLTTPPNSATDTNPSVVLHTVSGEI